MLSPIHAVEVTLAVNGDSDFRLMSATSLSFDSTNWNLPHTVQLYANPDTDSVSDTANLILSSVGMPSVSVSLSEVDISTSLSSGVLVSGVVMNQLGVGLGDVSISLSNGGGLATSDVDGSFLVELPANWSGTVSFVKDGYSFAPSTLNLGPALQRFNWKYDRGHPFRYFIREWQCHRCGGWYELGKCIH